MFLQKEGGWGGGGIEPSHLLQMGVGIVYFGRQ